MRYFAILLFTVALVACSNTDFTPMSDVHYRPFNGLIQVTDHEPDVNHVRLGIITVHASSVDSADAMIELLKERAAGMGANVIVIMQGRQPAGHNLLFIPQSEMSAMAIRTVR
jgi:hypothetical protein